MAFYVERSPSMVTGGQVGYATGQALGQQQARQQGFENLLGMAGQRTAQYGAKTQRQLGERSADVQERLATVQEQLAEVQRLVDLGQLDLAVKRFNEIEKPNLELAQRAAEQNWQLGLAGLQVQSATAAANAPLRSQMNPSLGGSYAGVGPYSKIPLTISSSRYQAPQLPSASQFGSYVS